ncbi:hypothetical protein [Blastococcus sp. DSM 46786]|uniref:hypothetical protein n=1 Tax=Blastococcus sp. DSM 46786 TaxID=1798227 RepID=UPI000B84A8E0|nr:hypothetical protein [Blastococcus sp. DSM 46786]
MGDISGGDSSPAAPQVIISWSHASNAGRGFKDPAAKRAADEAWRDEVLEFFVALRRSGIDAEIDLAHFSERGVDWTRWGPTMVRERDVIAVVNAGWRRAWEESGDGFTGRGAAAEVDVLLSIFNEDRDVFQEKVLLVLLPGSDDSDVPYGLGRLQRVRVRAFDDDGLTPLLRILTDQPEYPLPPLGAIPLLPAAASAVIQRRLDHPAAVEGRVGAHDHVGITDSVTVELVRGGAEKEAEAEAELRDEIALLRSALRQVPQPGPGEGPHIPWFRTWEQLQIQLDGLQRQLAALEARAPASSSAPSSQDELRLASLLDGVGAEVERSNRCWLLLAAAPAAQQAAVRGADRATVEQRREQLTRWRETRAPVVSLDWSTEAVRRPGRVTFTGELARGPGFSTRWRVELLDDGSAVVGAAVAETPLADGMGSVAWPGQAGQTLRDAAIYLPVRRDLLEIWTLTAVELAVYQALRDAESGGELVLQARLILPIDLAMPGVHDPRRLGVRIVEEVRDEDGHHDGDRPVPGGFDLPLDGQPPCSAPNLVRLPAADSPRAVVQAARHLAGALLEFFGVEGTAVLRADNTLDPFAAAEGDQQVTYQHARALGLPVDPRGPAERRRRYDELVAEARAQLRPE